jgi:predicted transcriptional regulator
VFLPGRVRIAAVFAVSSSRIAPPAVDSLRRPVHAGRREQPVKIREIMSKFPVYIHLGADIRRAAEILSISAVGDLMVMDYDNHFVGVLSESDLIRSLLPNFEEVVRAGGTLDDAFKFVERKGSDLVARPIDPLVNHDAITLKAVDEIAQAAVVMIEKNARCLPVIEDGKLVGSVSRADICRAVIYYA